MATVSDETVLIDAAREALRTEQKGTRLKIQNYLAMLDPAAPRTLSFAVEALLGAGFEQKELAELIGVSRTTVSRWAQEQNVPRSPAFRGWVVNSFLQYLDESVKGPDEDTQSRRPLPQHAAGYKAAPRK